MTKISVITATKNCALTIGDCLGSLQSQSYNNWQHIVIDGASLDGTVEILNSHKSQLSVFLSEPDRGIYDALNKGIKSASGDVVGFLHSDDFYAHRDVLSNIASIFEADSSISAVYGDLEYVFRDDVSNVVRLWKAMPFSKRRLSWGWMPPHPTLYVRREFYERIGGFDDSYRISADYLSILELFSKHDFKVVYLPQVLVKMRIGGISNRSLKFIVIKLIEDWQILRRTKMGAWGGVGALIWKNLGKIFQFI